MSASLPFRQSFPPFDIVRGDGSLPGVEAEAAVSPREELAALLLADEPLPTERGEEAVAKEFGERFEALIRPPRPAGSPCVIRLRLRPKRPRPSAFFDRQDVEAPVPIHQPGGGEDVQEGRMLR